MAINRTDAMSVNTLGDLSCLHVAELDDGCEVYVRSESQYYTLDKTSGATADGATVIAPLSGSPIAGFANARWLSSSSSEDGITSLLWVDPEAAETGDGSYSRPFQTIQEAIDLAEESPTTQWTINCLPGDCGDADIPAALNPSQLTIVGYSSLYESETRTLIGQITYTVTAANTRFYVRNCDLTDIEIVGSGSASMITYLIDSPIDGDIVQTGTFTNGVVITCSAGALGVNGNIEAQSYLHLNGVAMVGDVAAGELLMHRSTLQGDVVLTANSCSVFDDSTITGTVTFPVGDPGTIFGDPTSLANTVSQGTTVTNPTTGTTGYGLSRVYAGPMQVSGGFALSASATPTVFAANTNNLSVASINVVSQLRIAASTPVDLTGIVPPPNAAGKILILINVGAEVITLTNDATSTAANRFLLPVATIALATNGVVTLMYDVTSSRWRVIGLINA